MNCNAKVKRHTALAITVLTATVLVLLCLAVPVRAQDERNPDVKPSGTIPVLSFTFQDPEDIEKMNNSDNHQYKAKNITLDIIVPEGYTNSDGLVPGESVSGLKLDYMRGRGNSTWTRSFKKPYKFKLDKKEALFGMNASKHWALLCERMDPSLSRNRLTNWLGQQMGLEYTPRCIPVDLVLNGEYYGSYILSENIRVDKASIDIDELTADVADPNSKEITGGYLLGMAFDESETDYFETEGGTGFTNITPSFDTEADDDAYECPAQMNYIRSYIQDTENAIFGDGYKDAGGVPYSEYMDVLSAANYWWIQEFSMNDDAFNTTSTYLYKKRNDKLYWGPLWDFDIAWVPGVSGCRGFISTDTAWFERLRTDPAFAELLKERWAVLDEKLEYVTMEGGLLDQYADEIRESWKTDRAANGPFEYDSEPFETCDEAMDDLRSFIDQRRAWISANIDNVGKVYSNVEFISEGQTVRTIQVKAGEYLPDDLPKAAAGKGYVFAGWYPENSDIAVDECDRIYEDTVLYAHFLRANPMTASGSKHTLKRSALKKRSVSIKAAKAYKVRNAKGKLSYALKSISSRKYAKKFTVNKKTGKITVKKGVKKGVYKLKIKITAAGTKSYAKKTRTVTVTIRVK